MQNVDLYHMRDLVRVVESSSGTAYIRLNRKFMPDTILSPPDPPAQAREEESKEQNQRRVSLL